MRLATVTGALLLALGAFLLVRGVSYTAQRSVLKLGDFEAKVEEQRSVPPWVGGVFLLAGAGLVSYGRKRREGAEDVR